MQHNKVYSVSKAIIFFALLLITTPDSAVGCPAGWAGGDPCVQCVAGKYKESVSNMDCASCAPGKYSTIVGSSSRWDCVSCPANTFSPWASDEQTDCICNAGYTTGSTGSCVQCAGGKYKVQTGNGACVHCIAGKYSTIVGATNDYLHCWMCDPGTSTRGLTTRSHHTQCEDCIPGKYATGWGNARCTTCSAGKYASGTRATTCVVPCPAGSIGPNEEGLCVQCAAGTYTDGLTISAECSQCVAGKYSSENAATVCTECPANTRSPEGSSQELDCVCNAGAYFSTQMSCSGGCPCPSAWGVRSGEVLGQT